MEVERVAASAGHTEEGPSLAVRLDRHQDRPVGSRRSRRRAEVPGQLLNGRTLEQRGERQIAAKLLLDLRHQPQGHQRVPPEVEEAVPHPDEVKPQHFLPELDELVLDLSAGRYRLRSRREARRWAQRRSLTGGQH